VFPTEAWRDCRDSLSTIADGPVAFAVDVSWDRSAAHVAAVGKRADGLWHAQLVHTCDPTEVVAWLVDATTKRETYGVALQANGAPVSSLLPDLERELTCTVWPMAAADVPRSCGIAFDAVKALQVRHLGQSQIDRALSIAETRTLSDGWALDRKRSRLDIAPLVAWVHALWLASTFDDPPDPVGFFITT